MRLRRGGILRGRVAGCGGGKTGLIGGLWGNIRWLVCRQKQSSTRVLLRCLAINRRGSTPHHTERVSVLFFCFACKLTFDDLELTSPLMHNVGE